MELHKEQKIKNFLRVIYEPIIITGNNLKDNEQIIICFKNSSNGNMEQKSFNNIDDIILYLRDNPKLKYCETYFNLHTTNGNRKKDDIVTATCIGLDFDKKGIDLNIDYIQRKFKECNLFYNIIVDTGNGYHAYILLEETKDIELVTQVTKQIAKLTGADPQACKPTQLMRLPLTWNNKKLSNKIRKPVVLIHIDENIKRKNINLLAKKLLKHKTNNKTVRTFKGNACKKIEELMSIPCTNRHDNLLWLYGKLLQFNNTEGQIQIKLDEFQKLNKLEDWEYQIKYLKENGKPISSCNSCKYVKECRNYIESDFEYLPDELLLHTNEKVFSKCKKKGAKQMNGNEIVIYGILKLFNKPLSKDELLEEITFRNKKKEVINRAMSDKTLRENLKEMENKKIIISETVNRKKYYKLGRERTQEELNLEVRASVCYDVVKGYLTAEELQFYCFLRYLQHEQRRLTPNIGGNKFIMTQEEIAKKYGVTRRYIIDLIAELDRKKYIRIDKTKSANNMHDYNIYYLVH